MAARSVVATFKRKYKWFRVQFPKPLDGRKQIKIRKAGLYKFETSEWSTFPKALYPSRKHLPTRRTEINIWQDLTCQGNTLTKNEGNTWHEEDEDVARHA